MTEFFVQTVAAFWSIMLDAGVWLVVGLLLAGLVHALIPQDFLTRHLASEHRKRPSIKPILKASLLGIPMPLCSCSVIPVAASIRAAGASKGASAAFAISTPQTGEESVPLTWALFGPVYAFTRPIVAVFTAFVAGVLIDRFAGDPVTSEHDSDASADEDVQLPLATSSCCSSKATVPVKKESSSCCSSESAPPVQSESSSCCATPKQTGHGSESFGSKIIESIRYGFGVLLPDLAPWLAIGLVLSAVISAAVPVGWIGSTIGTGLGPMLLMVVVGLPLYVCATSTTPLAYTLVVAGLSPGAALVLLLAGPASNAATMSWIIKDLGVRALAIYLGVIAAISVFAGWVFDALLADTLRLAESNTHHDHSKMGAVLTVGAIVMTALLLVGLAARVRRLMLPTT